MGVLYSPQQIPIAEFQFPGGDSPFLPGYSLCENDENNIPTFPLNFQREIQKMILVLQMNANKAMQR